MKPQKITAVYFSPAGNTKAVTEMIAKSLSEKLDIPLTAADFTLPAARGGVTEFGPDDLIVFGTPTYAGRIPNKALPFVENLFRGNATPAVAIVTFGNRDYDSSLTELVSVLTGNGFRPFAAGAFACEHSFTDKLAPGRPDASDKKEIEEFTERACNIVRTAKSPDDITYPVEITGRPEVMPYYTPLGIDGKPAKFLKAKPITDMTKCSGCGICARVCPMGSVDPDDITQTPGICIKCQACIKKCPANARYFDDPALLSHISYLEAHYRRRANNSVFLSVS